MTTAKKEVVICIPGLGGHESSLSNYKELLTEYDLKFLELVDHEQSLKNLIKMCEEEERADADCEENKGKRRGPFEGEHCATCRNGLLEADTHPQTLGKPQRGG